MPDETVIFIPSLELVDRLEVPVGNYAWVMVLAAVQST